MVEFHVTPHPSEAQALQGAEPGRVMYSIGAEARAGSSGPVCRFSSAWRWTSREAWRATDASAKGPSSSCYIRCRQRFGGRAHNPLQRPRGKS